MYSSLELFSVELVYEGAAVRKMMHLHHFSPGIPCPRP